MHHARIYAAGQSPRPGINEQSARVRFHWDLRDRFFWYFPRDCITEYHNADLQSQLDLPIGA
jgi:hypothetical protein